jgi:aryl-alcohol dehydrogenase-like predicted oxidoreductase
METRRIGDLSVSVVGLGCNQFGTVFDEAASLRVIAGAYDLGVTFFDTADEYGDGLSETFVGRALKPVRDKVVIATKFGRKTIVPAMSPMVKPRPSGEGGASARWIATSVERSLKNLGTDYIDLYQLHVPDPDVPIAETLGALDALVRAGKVRAIGCSSFSAAQIDEARLAAGSGAHFVSVQNRLNLLRQEALDEVIPACRRHGMGFLPYFPLASGMLTGKYRAGVAPVPGTRLGDSVTPEMAARALNEKTMATIAALEAFAKARGRTLLDLAMSWLAAEPALASIIAGARSVEQVKANVAAAAWRLSPAELAEATALGRG